MAWALTLLLQFSLPTSHILRTKCVNSLIFEMMAMKCVLILAWLKATLQRISANTYLMFGLAEQKRLQKFCVESTVKAEDEWLHSFFYFNDEIPTDADFEKAIGDFLTFEFSMIMQNREYLFSQDGEKNEKP